jgi:hypothetical protein
MRRLKHHRKLQLVLASGIVPRSQRNIPSAAGPTHVRDAPNVKTRNDSVCDGDYSLLTAECVFTFSVVPTRSMPLLPATPFANRKIYTDFSAKEPDSEVKFLAIHASILIIIITRMPHRSISFCRTIGGRV